MTRTSANTSAAHRLRGAPLTLAGLFLFGMLALGPTSTQAQVQIDQVGDVSSQIDGATQGQVVVSLSENCAPGEASCESVGRTDVLDLIPAIAPPLDGTDQGNSAVIVQDGAKNEATITQRGSQNEASATQLGADNTTTITQGALSGYSGRASVLSGRSNTGGTGNLAVSVQRGRNNTTNIQQYGSENTAGIRLDGSNNEMGLLQVGTGNEYLLDYAGSGLDMAGPNRIEQIGNNNALLQEGRGKPISVQMRGNGIRMRIRHNTP